MHPSLKILILEDNPFDADLAISMLTSAGYQCEWDLVVGRDDYVERIISDDDYDIILSDYNLPGFDGLEALEIYQRYKIDIPFIFISGVLGEEVAIESLHAGATDYVLKDRLPRLVHVVQRALREYDERTRRREAESAAAHVNRQYQDLINSIDGIVWEFDLQFDRFTFVSAQAERLLGYPIQEWISEPDFWEEHLHPEDRDFAVELCAYSREQGVDHELEYRMVASDGRSVWLHELVSVIRENRKATKMRGIMFDITGRKEVESALRISEERYRSLLENLPIPVFTKDVAGVYTSSNVENQKYWSENPVGKSDEALLNDEAAAALRQIDLDVMNSGKTITVEEHLTDTPMGERYVLSRKMLLRDNKGQRVGVLGASLDITERKQLEEQLRQAQKMEAIGQLTAGVAHDFNNFLMVISLTASLIKSEVTGNQSLTNKVRRISDACRHATNLISQLMTFSSQQVIDPKILNLNDLLQRNKMLLRRIIGEHIKLETRLSPQLWATKIDATQFEQIIINLAVNARDAMPDGGKLRIETKNFQWETDKNDRLTPLNIAPGDYVILTVKDTGVGMTTEVRERIFDPFFTTKEAGQGTGLGLATAYGIVNASNGSITVASEVGKGTIFEIYLPRSNEEHSLSDIAQPRKELPASSATILLVEDEDGVRKTVSEILNAQGYVVLSAKDGQDALQLASRHRQDIHLLLTDVIMPHVGGKLLAKKLRQTRPDIKVIFMSGYDDDAIPRQTVNGPKFTFLQKPFSQSFLLEQVDMVLTTPVDGA